MTTKKLENNIENAITAKLQFEHLAGFNKSNILVEKTGTKQSNQLNFYIPEKWDYEMDI